MSFDLLKWVYWDLTSGRRVQYIEALIRNIPSEFGVKLRETWYGKRFKKAGGNLRVLLGSLILHPENIECGSNVSIGAFCYIQAGGGLVMGDDVLLGPHVRIWTLNHKYNDINKPIWKQGYDEQPVVIGDDVWIGSGAFIMPGARIGNHCVISACSVVGRKKYPDGTILAGNPARKVGQRLTIESRISNADR